MGSNRFMSIDDKIIKFVKSIRCDVNTSELTEDKQTKLKLLFDDCLFVLVNKYVEEYMPSLIICDTYNKYSSVLPVKLDANSYKYYILYDYHLSQINRLFDALYFDNKDSEHDVYKLSCQLFAEDALLENKDILVSYYGLNKLALGSYDVNIEEQEELDFIIDIQDRYVIGHELGHWIYEVYKSNESIFNINFDVEWGQFLKNIKAILCDLYEQYEKIFKLEEYIELLHEQRKLVNENDKLFEECFADSIAYAMIFSHVAENYSDNLNRRLLAGQALFLEMMNLQLLAMQHMAISEESFESSTSIRIGFLRNYMRLYFEGNEKKYDEMLEETVIRYEERITNIMLECFGELEDEGDNIYDALIDVDGKLNFDKLLELNDVYQNSDLI